MKIKRTFAPTMREALILVKQEQGDDAVILGNKKVPGGIEILSAVDFDEVAMNSLQTPSPSLAVDERQPVDIRLDETIQQPVNNAAPIDTVSKQPEDNWADSILRQNQEERREPTLGPVAGSIARQRPASKSIPAKTVTTQKTTKPSTQTPTADFQALFSQQPRQEAAVKQPRTRATAKRAPATKKPMRPAARAAAARAAASKPKQPTMPPVIDEVKLELQNLRDLMESQLSVLQWDRFSQKNPVRSVLLNLLSQMGLGSDVCELVLSHLDENSNDPHKVWQKAIGILASCLPISRRRILSDGGRVALVGATGVGKTTTLAKIAARFAHSHGKREVAMISTDQFRMGAHEQLAHFAKLLEIPLLSAANSDELADRLAMLQDKKLVLIDTAGLNHRDMQMSERFHELQLAEHGIEPYLVLSANTQLAALNQTILDFSKVQLAGAFVTKLDEAASLGGIMTVLIRHQLALSYCGVGQKVPEDLEAPKSHRLVSKAVALMQQYSESGEQDILAQRFGRLISGNQAQI